MLDEYACTSCPMYSTVFFLGGFRDILSTLPACRDDADSGFVAEEMEFFLVLWLPTYYSGAI